MFIEKKKVAGAVVMLLLASAGLAQKALALVCECTTNQGAKIIRFGSGSLVRSCSDANGTTKDGKNTGGGSQVTLQINKCKGPYTGTATVDFTTQD